MTHTVRGPLILGDWEIAIQSPEGGAGEPVGVYVMRPRIFNTGQVILGWVALFAETGDNKYGYIRVSQPLNMLNIKPVMRFIRILNARNSVNFCTIFPCAKDSS